MTNNINAIGLLILVVTSFAIISAIVLFIRTPSSERWSKVPKRKAGVEYAPMYTREEQLKSALISLSWVVPLVLLLKFWFSPKLENFSKNASCYQFGEINGVTVLAYGLFFGLPIFTAMAILALAGLRSIRAFRAAQFPPPNVKVVKLTPYKYGLRARLMAIIPLLFALLLICMSFGGLDEAKRFHGGSCLKKELIIFKLPFFSFAAYRL